MVQILEEQMDRRGEALTLLRPVLQRTIADVQHRLTFRAQAFIKVCIICAKKRKGSQSICFGRIVGSA